MSAFGTKRTFLHWRQIWVPVCPSLSAVEFSLERFLPADDDVPVGLQLRTVEITVEGHADLECEAMAAQDTRLPHHVCPEIGEDLLTTVKVRVGCLHRPRDVGIDAIDAVLRPGIKTHRGGNPVRPLIGEPADILIVDGNPLEDITVLGANPKYLDAEPRERGIETIRVIMKDGRIDKNTL